MSAQSTSAALSLSLRRSAIAAALGLSLCFVALPEPAVAEPTVAQEDEKKKKKRRKQRGKVVKATVVPVAPAEPAPKEEAPAETVAAETVAEEAAAEDASTQDAGPAESAAAEEAAARKAAAQQERADREAAAAEAREAKRADREAKRRAEQEQKEQERADRAAAKQQEEDQRTAEREQQREAEQAEQAARAAADREATRQREEAREAKRAEAEAAAQAKAEARAEKEARRAAAETAQAESEAATAEPAVVSTRSAAPAPEPERPAAAPARTADRPAPAPANDVRAGDLSETIQVREVLLDVLVTDRKGNVLEGLSPADFEVTEDGRPVEVTSVVFYGGAEELQSAGIEERRTDRYFMLLFHDQAQAAPFLRAAQLDNGRWVQKWIDEELQPNDQVAVLGYDVRLKVFQDFTTDKVLLSQAVEAAARGGAREPDRWRTEEADPARDGSPSLLINLPKGKALSRETRRIQNALELIGRASEGIVGRKNLMLFSAGFGDIDQIGVWTPDPRFYPPMKESLNTGNVDVYSIDLVGSRRGAPQGRDINDALSAISNDTGGNYYATFANALTPLRNVADDNLGYYLLSYRSEFERGTSGYREVKVKVARPEGGKKPKVKARKGYRFGT
ncbi:MAG: VWA domain-containing protein [Acidobacteriota bacterium]